MRATVHAALLASVANLVIYVMAWALWDVPAGFTVLSPVSIVVSTTIGIVAAVAGLEVLSKWLRRPVPLFIVSTIALTLLSLAGPIQAMAGAMAGQPAATTATGLTMIAMHLVTGGFIIGLLPATKRN